MKTLDTINGKTPEEIKKGLEEEIPVHYHLPNPEPRLHPTELMQLQKLHGSALTYIQHLESRLAQAEWERDAAVADLKNVGCCLCKHAPAPDLYIHNECLDCVGNCNFEWRGVCPENTKEDAK